MMRKTFYYTFFPTKAEEEATVSRNAKHHVTRTIVEIRDWLITPQRLIDHPKNPWQIRRTVTRNEVTTGEFILSHEEMFEHVFRFWNVEAANQLVQGNNNKCFVFLMDYTEENMPKGFQSCYLKSGGNGNDSYVVGLMEVVRVRVVNPGDEIGLFWDMRPSSYGFGFKLLRRGNSH